MSDDEKSDKWSQIDSFKYLTVYEKYRPLFKKHKASLVFSLISNSLKEYDIFKTESQCTRKYSNLLRSYRKCLSRQQASSNQKFPYFNKMHELETSIQADLTEDLQDEVKSFIKITNLQGKHFLDENLRDETLHDTQVKENYYKNNTWTHDETLKLIRIYTDMNHEKNAWNKIVSELKKLQVHKTSAECSKKWSNLLRSFKKNNNNDGKKVTKFCYYDEMTKAINDSKKINLIVIEEHENSLLRETTSDIQNYDSYDPNMEMDNISNSSQTTTFNQIIEEFEVEEANLSEEEDSDAIFHQFFTDNFMTICKVCLKQKEDLSSLTDEDLLSQIKDLFHQSQENSIEGFDPEVSNLICSDCIQKITQFYTFKKMYNMSYSFLEQFKTDYIVLGPKVDQDILKSEDVENAGFEVIEEIIEFFDADTESLNLDTTKKSPNSKKPMYKNPSKICEVCGSTVRKKNYKSHLLIHSGEKNYACDVCKRAFRTSSSCKIHLATHKKERKFTCLECSKSFICRNSLAKHKLVHSRELKHECTVCFAKFYRQSSFRTHQASHGLGLSHFCNICNKGFLWEARLKEHMYEHEGLKPFKCQLCSKVFSKLRNLRSHMRLNHNNKVKHRFKLVGQNEDNYISAKQGED